MDTFNLYSENITYAHPEYPSLYPFAAALLLVALIAGASWIVAWFYHHRTARRITGGATLASVICALGIVTLVPATESVNANSAIIHHPDAPAGVGVNYMDADALNDTIDQEVKLNLVNYIKYNGQRPDYVSSLIDHYGNQGVNLSHEEALTVLSLNNGERLTTPLVLNDGMMVDAEITGTGEVTLHSR